MSKFKLLLLGGIISILTIGSFTSANLFGSVKDYYNGWGAYNDPTFGMNVSFNTFYCEGNGTVQITAEERWHGSVQITVNCPGYYNGMYEGNGIDYIISLQRSSTSVSVYNKSSNTPSMVFTPVLNGLSGALLEFIPYVVYVGLGVLGVLIGFFAIKRLINWVRRQSLGVFSSRKKK